jgi:hypothetical protein
MQMIGQGLGSEDAAQNDARPEPASTPGTNAPLCERLMEAGFVGGVFLALTLLVVASVGR